MWGKQTTMDPQVIAIHEERRRLARGRSHCLPEDYDPKNFPPRTTWRNRRWVMIAAINLLFVISYQLDIQILEGSLAASRFLGFHLADPFAAVQVWLAFGHVILNLVIGVCTLTFLYIIVGGRAFCSWVCPYHLLGEWAEKLHLWLVEKKMVSNHPFQVEIKYLFWGVFLLLPLITGYTVFETISPVGVLSRAMIYGSGMALIWVILLLAVEVFYSRRAWCRYVCPVGTTLRFVGALSLTRVRHDMTNCHHDGACRAVCLVPHVLEFTKLGKAPAMINHVSGDCTNCGMCVDVCPSRALSFEVRFLDKLM